MHLCIQMFEKGCSGNWIEHVVKPPKYVAPECIPLWHECEPPNPYGGKYYTPPPPCCGAEPPCHTPTGAVCTAGAPDCKCDAPIEDPSGGGYGGGHGGGYGGYRPKNPFPICHTYSHGGYSQCIPADHVHNGGGYGYGGIEEDKDIGFLMNSMSFSMAATEEDDGGEIEFGNKNLRS